MPETVCVTVEQLREILRNFKGPEIVMAGCPYIAVTVDDFEAALDKLGNAIAQAERLKGWKPKVGDRVRLRAMPEIKGEITELYSDGVSGFVLHDTNGSQWGAFRYLAELMPEEGE